jgi:hypothetical protein
MEIVTCGFLKYLDAVNITLALRKFIFVEALIPAFPAKVLGDSPEIFANNRHIW